MLNLVVYLPRKQSRSSNAVTVFLQLEKTTLFGSTALTFVSTYSSKG